MTLYLIEPKDQIFVKGDEFLSFAKNMSKNISKNVSSKYSQKHIYHAKKLTADTLKTVSKGAIQKIPEGNL